MSHTLDSLINLLQEHRKLLPGTTPMSKVGPYSPHEASGITSVAVVTHEHAMDFDGPLGKAVHLS